MAEPYELKYERALTYTSATVDSAAVVAIADVCGARININFTRMDTKICRNSNEDGNSINLIPNAALKTERKGSRVYS